MQANKDKDKFGYVANIISHTTVTREADTTDEWDRDSTHTDNTFAGIHKTQPLVGYPDFVTAVDFQPGEEVFVVWLEYSTGDSFGHYSHSSTELVGVFKAYIDAKNLKDAILDSKDEWQPLIFTTSTGETLEYYQGSWHDYFGGLEQVHIEKTWMQGVR